MNMIDLMQMAGATAPAADTGDDFVRRQLAAGKSPKDAADAASRMFVPGQKTPPAGAVGLPADPAQPVGVGGPAPSTVADLTAPTVRSLASALAPPPQQGPQQPQMHTVGAADAGAYGLVLPNGQTVYPPNTGMGNYSVPSAAGPGAGSQPGSSMPTFDQYLQQQAGKSGMSALQQASTFAPGSQARAGAQQEYSGLLGAQQKFGLDTNQQKIEQQKIAAGLVGVGVQHEGDAAKELGVASKNAYVQAYNEVKGRGGADAEADKAGMDRMAQVANADEAFKRMKQGAKAGTPAGGVGVAPGAAAPGLPAAPPAAPANKGALVGMETDPLVQGLFQTSGPQGATPTGVIDNGKLDVEKFLTSYGGLAGANKLTPEQKKGVAQALATRLGGAQNASQQMLDALAERQLFGGVPTAGDFSLSKLPNAESVPSTSWGGLMGKLMPSADAFNLNAGYQLTAPGFQSKHYFAPNRVATPTLGKTKQRYAQQAPVLADLLSYTLPLTQQ